MKKLVRCLSDYESRFGMKVLNRIDVSNDPVNWVDPEGLRYWGAYFKSKFKNPLPTYPSNSDWHYNRNDNNTNKSYQEAKDTWDGSVPATFHKLPEQLESN
jgi:hypothetical protein